jgi:SAP domain-containing ribonucleoprotein
MNDLQLQAPSIITQRALSSTSPGHHTNFPPYQIGIGCDFKTAIVMAEYAKKKNDELQTLCKERGLPHNGKKADLVKRLEDHDAQSTTAAPETGKAAPAEDEIDWDEEPATETAKAATSEPNATAIAAGGLGQPPNPQAVPNQQVGEDPTVPDKTVGAAPAAPKIDDAPTGTEAAGEPRKTPEDFTLGLQERTLDEEIAKRKKRAEKFGIDPSSDETLKQLERAKRFGTTNVPGLLNQALPQRAEKEKKRVAEGVQEDGVRKRSRVRPGAGSKQGSERKEKSAANGRPGSWMTEADKHAAEKRKARFAAHSAE